MCSFQEQHIYAKATSQERVGLQMSDIPHSRRFRLDVLKRKATAQMDLGYSEMQETWAEATAM